MTTVIAITTFIFRRTTYRIIPHIIPKAFGITLSSRQYNQSRLVHRYNHEKAHTAIITVPTFAGATILACFQIHSISRPTLTALYDGKAIDYLSTRFHE